MNAFKTLTEETLAKLAQSHTDLKHRILSLEAENRRLQARMAGRVGEGRRDCHGLGIVQFLR